MINKIKVKQGDVWLADVVFKATRQTKQRPVIIAPVTCPGLFLHFSNSYGVNGDRAA